MTMATLFILEITATFLIIPHTLTKVQFDIFCSISYPKEVTIALGCMFFLVTCSAHS